MASDEFPFYTESELLDIKPPVACAGFEAFWSRRFEATMQIHPRPTLKHSGRQVSGFELYDLTYQSTDGVTIGGWVTVPIEHIVKRVLVIGHGYGGCPEPSAHVPLRDAACVWPCLRGLGRSALVEVPDDPYYHVLFDLHDREQYILAGCVEDLWQATSAAQKLFPAAKNRMGMTGISFSGGIGMLALPWDERIRLAHFEVPTFGHHELRMKIPSWGSAKALQDFYRKNPSVLKTLAFYDAATAAQFAKIPIHIAAALHDPFVAPPGQFAIYNALSSDRDLYVLKQGHSEYDDAEKQKLELLEKLKGFFSML